MGGPQEWSESDRDKALAWQELEDDKCPGCGNPLSETTDFGRRTDWEAEKVTCHGCRSRSAKASDSQPGDYLVVTSRSARVG